MLQLLIMAELEECIDGHTVETIVMGGIAGRVVVVVTVSAGAAGAVIVIVLAGVAGAVIVIV
jgi:hypothetical protein